MKNEKVLEALKAAKQTIIDILTSDSEDEDGECFLIDCKQAAKIIDALDCSICELRKSPFDEAIKIVEAIRKDLAGMYAIVCETESQKAVASAVDAALDVTEMQLKARAGK